MSDVSLSSRSVCRVGTQGRAGRVLGARYKWGQLELRVQFDSGMVTTAWTAQRVHQTPVDFGERALVRDGVVYGSKRVQLPCMGPAETA